MTDYPHRLAGAIAETVTAAEHRGHHQLAETHTAAIEHLENELWRDLMRSGSLWSNIRLVYNGRDLHPSAFMTGRIGDGMIVHAFPDTDTINRYLRDGATLIYNHLHETSYAVQRIQETLEYQLGARAWIQAYLTRTGESAFGLHVDDHNFIVLQVFGRKDWQVDFTGTSGEDTPVTKLAPGQLIAVPSNTPHRVCGCGTLSLHLTIAFDWLDGTREGSVIPTAELDAHRGAARLGSAIPLDLCDDLIALRLPFKFRDRARPTVTREDGVITIACHAATVRIDDRFAGLATALADGAELTKAEILQRYPQLGENDLDKFLRFGVENRLLHCSG